ncbi:5'-nucleotidase C-terminal domain-containing protein [Paenibacillus chartarius]|uniref:5'-nucleotidase C-terminal domain-containing protein n=1 Tax=Paenibacillus chartarius TaxID=747481 RepID=A0ABV6DE19_9BACL
MGSIAHVTLSKQANGQIAIAHEFLKADETVKEDASLAALAAEYQAKLEQELSKKIAAAESSLPYGDNHESRFRETAIGNLIADAYRDYYQTDIAFANGGGIRASINKGDFTLKDAKSILPFGNKIVVAEVTGDMLLAALENSVSAVDKLAGGFLQTSGLTYSYNPSLPAGQRITQAAVAGTPLVKERLYKLALSNYMYTGGDKYTMFKDAKTIVGANEALTDFELLIAYAEKQKMLSAKEEGRIAVNGFADVTNGHWAAREVYELVGKGVLTGMDEARFAPLLAVKRGEFIGYVGKVLGLEPSKIFASVGWSADRADEAVSREEMAAVLKWSYELKSGRPLPNSLPASFRDQDQIAVEAQPAVSGLVEIGVLSGREDNKFAPKEPASRAEIARVLWKLSEIEK